MTIIFIGSFGGHLSQLERIAELLAAERRIFVTTRDIQGAADRYVITDFNKSNVWRGGRCLWEIIRIVRNISFDAAVSTGAAPGLLFLLVARCQGRKTVWIDSIANSRKMSLSGRLASVFCHLTLSQWPEVASRHRRVTCLGGVL